MKLFTIVLPGLVCAGLAVAIGPAPNTWGQEVKPASTTNAASALPEGLPEDYGFYVKTERGWERLHQNRASKTEVKRGGFTQWTGIGVGGMHEKLDYRGPHAQLQTLQPRPVFYARMADATHIQDLMIVRFKEKKDKRQIEAAEMVGERTGGGETRNKAAIYSVTVRRLTPEVFVVTPESDLEPGEYLISGSNYSEGYDFGITGTAVATKK